MGRLILFALALLTGCNNTASIQAEDHGLFIPSGRLSIDVEPRSSSPSDPHGGHAAELGASGTRGEDRQVINPGGGPVASWAASAASGNSGAAPACDRASRSSQAGTGTT